jgi:nitrite reductase/ring-hydroxylating ferredoxin subunit
LEFVRVAKMDDIPRGGMKGFVIKGKKILVAETSGQFYAIASVCTHLGGPLDKGRFDGEVVKCPWHGSLFDITSGKAVGGPAKNDVEAYEVKIENGQVFVKL